MVEESHREKAISAVITFDPHPLKVVRPEAAPPLIMTIAAHPGPGERGLSGAGDAPTRSLIYPRRVRQALVETMRAKNLVTQIFGLAAVRLK